MRFGGTLLAQFVLARLLLPEAYGITAMAFILTGFLAVFNESGFSLATIQKAELSRAESNAAFWLQLLLSAIVTLAAVLAAPAVGAYFDEPRVAWIVLAIAPSFLLTGAYAQQQALLRRDLRVALVAGLDLAAVMLSLVVAIAAAAAGAGYWALVAQQLTPPLVLLPAFWLASGWRPGMPSIRAARSHLDFGKHFTAYKVVEYAAKNLVDRALLGRGYGAHDLGLYTRASSFLTAPLTQVSLPLSMVMLPLLSREQNDPARFRALYLDAARALGWLTLPPAAFLYVAAPEVVAVLLGANWTDSIAIFQYASPGALAIPLTVLVNWLFLARGRTDRMLRWGIGSALVTVIASAIGVRGGAEGLALARSVAAIISLGGGILYGVRGSPLRARDFLPALAPPMIGAIATGFLVWVVRGTGLEAAAALLTLEVLAAALATAVGVSVSGDYRRFLLLVRPARPPAGPPAARGGG